MALSLDGECGALAILEHIHCPFSHTISLTPRLYEIESVIRFSNFPAKILNCTLYKIFDKI